MTTSIKALRLKAGMRQGELAKAVGCSQAYISQIESAKSNRTVPFDFAKRIAKALGHPVEKVLNISLTQKKRLMKLWGKLSYEDKNNALLYLEFLVERSKKHGKVHDQ